MLVTHSWNALGVGYSSYFQTQKYNNVITVGSVLLATCPHWPWYFLFVILMRWDSGHWLWSHHWLVTSGEGAVDVVSEMGLSRLTYFNVINWEDHIRTLRWLVSAQARVGTPGHRGLGSGLQMWPLAESPPGMAVSLVWCVVSPCQSFSLLVSAAIPGCHLYLSPAPSCHGDTMWELSRPSRSQGANWSLTDSRADWPLWHPAHWVESGWVWCRDSVNTRDVNCQLKLLFLSKKFKILLILYLTVAYQSKASRGSRAMHHSHTFACSG